MNKGNIVSELRERRGWSLRRLARETGLSVSTVHSAENGGNVRVSTVRAIADALGCDPVDVFRSVTTV